MNFLKSVLLGLLISSQAFAGLPPTTIKGQSDPSPVTTFNLQAPHSQITRLGGVNALIETGNANTLVNPNANGGTAGYAASGGTFTTGGTGNSTYFSFDSGSAGEIVSSGYQTIASGDQWSGQNGVVSGKFKCAAGTCTHKLQVYDGTTVLAESTITSSTTGFNRTSVNFIYPVSGTIRWQLVSVAADEPAVQWLSGYRGLAEGFNLTPATGAIVTAWVPSTHVVPTNLGSITSNNLMERRVGSSLEVTGTFQMGGGSGGSPALLVLSGLAIDPVVAGTIDGNKVGDFYMSASSKLALYGVGVPQAIVFYDGSITDRLFMATTTYTDNSRIFTQADASGIQPSMVSKATLHFSIPIAGWAAQVNGLNVLSDQAAASWSGFHNANCVWFSNSTTYVDPSNAASGSCALVEKKNRNFGTVTTFGGVQPGVTFTPLKKGFFMAIPSTMLSNTAGPSQAAILQLVDQNGAVLGTANSYQPTSTPTQIPIHGIFEVTDTTVPTTLKLQVASTNVANTSYIGNGTTNAIEWNIFQLDGAQSLPYFTGSVTSQTPGQEHVERLKIAGVCSATPCTITSQSGSWITSVSYAATGHYTLNIATGVFSAPPVCTVTPNSQSSAVGATLDDSVETATQINLQMFKIIDRTGIDFPFNVICMGPR